MQRQQLNNVSSYMMNVVFVFLLHLLFRSFMKPINSYMERENIMKHSNCRQFAQRSRVRKLQYIAELERNVQALQVSVFTRQYSACLHSDIF